MKQTIHKCKKCIGTGYLKYEKKICTICNGKKCIDCNYLGVEKMPWDLCDQCHGDGSIRK